MDELDRLFHRVVRAVRDAHPEYLSRSLAVGDLLEFVPYRTARADVGVETNDDFAHVVTRLLAGERGYLFADELMQDDLKAELSSPNPDLGAYRSYVNAHVTLSQEHMREALETIGPPVAVAAPATPPAPAATAPAATAPAATAPAATAPAATAPTAGAVGALGDSGVARTAAPTAAARPAPPRIAPPAEPRPSAARRAPVLSPRPLQPDDITPTRAARPGCKYCGQPLPGEREVNFCPACGQNQLARRCAGCSAELEAAWKFCVACGRAAAP